MSILVVSDSIKLKIGAVRSIGVIKKIVALDLIAE